MKRPSWFRQLSLGAIALSLFVFLFVLFQPTVTYAASKLPNPLIYSPCPPMTDCRGYDELEKVLTTAQDTILTTVLLAALNTFTYATQQLAQYSANFILSGGKGGGTAYENKTFGGFLSDVASNSLNNFIVDLNDYAKAATGFNLCSPFGLQAFDLQLSLGVGQIWQVKKKQGCGFREIVSNIETSSESLSQFDLFKNVRYNLQSDRSELGVSVRLQGRSLVNQFASLNSASQDRREFGGFKPVVDFISGRIQTPAQTFSTTLAETNALKQELHANEVTFNAMAFNAFQIGIYQLPLVFGATFLNTLATGGINALKQYISSRQSDTTLASAELQNPYAQSGADHPASRSISFTDIVTPNLLTTENQDFVHELSSCPTPRGLWGCAMDDTFAAGLRAFNDNGAYTVAHAMGVGTNGQGFIFLHSDWELIPESETKDNQDPGCYQRAYCGSNLSKLRFARILPIGWELAANSPYNKKVGGRYVTLGDVARNFNNCNDKGKLDAAHPWCHLVDPSWVLTAPLFQCRVKGYSDSVLSSSFPSRMQECSDVISCLEHNDKGQCVGGYGYCLSEKTVWRFDADACQERFVSCRTYQKRNANEGAGGSVLPTSGGGAVVSYLRNTIDYGSCNEGNVGCLYYATTRDVTSSSTDRWVGSLTPYTSATVTTPAVGPTLGGARVYFDANLEHCDASGDGCTKVLRAKDGESALNLVENGSFETPSTADATKPSAWSVSGDVKLSSTAEIGTSGLAFGAGSSMRQSVPVVPLRNYVLSYYARIAEGASTGNLTVVAEPHKSDGKLVASGTKFYRNTTTCKPIAIDELIQVDATGLSSAWQRYTCEFVSNSDAAQIFLIVSGSSAVMDGIQLEEADRATDFVDGDNVNLETDYLKLSPVELGCSGDPKKDRPECARYAQICRQTDAGCQGYTEIGASDATQIPATLTANDLCPAECVGYAEYRKLPSSFDLVKNPTVPALDDPADETSAFFVPSSANACTSASVGCEEFTNVDSVATGGEAKGYFSSVRACQKPNDNTQTYFTWEGSDTTGYQLRTWSLIRDATKSPAPPLLITKAGPDGLVKAPESCTETLWKSGADPDCRQFYDEKGNAFYVYFSQTVISSPDCRNYRKNDSDFADCKKTGGNFNATTKECVYSILPAESTSCTVQDAGCRGYIGSTGRNTAVVLSEQFKGTSVPSFVNGGAGTDLALSGEALAVGDKSLKVARASGGPATLSFSLTYPSATGTLYTIVLWTKTTDISTPRKIVTVTVDGTTVGTFTPETDWRRFELGSFTPGKTPSSVLTFTGVPQVTYIDEIAIRRLQDVVFVKKNSWITPATCDQTAEGVPQPQAMLGCRAYRDQTGRTVDARQFSHLCRFESVGCTAYVDTRNSDSSYAQSFTLKGVDKIVKPWDSLYAGSVTVTRPADRYVYAIDAPGAHCTESQMSCRSFGKPKFNPDLTLPPNSATVSAFETVYLKDDITKYVDESGEPKMLCRPSELFCEKFTSGNITSYFRDPGDHTCEWRDKVPVPAGSLYGKGEYSGWFVKGSDPPQPCYQDKLSTGNVFLSEFSAGLGYRGWTDTCPADQSECTEFRDPNDHTNLQHPQGRPYYFINNDKLDKSTCNGRVDLLSGCVLFRDMNDSRLSFSTVATYAKSNKEDGSAESPINCVTDPTNPYCKGRCGEFKSSAGGEEGFNTAAEFIRKQTNALCSTNADCSQRLTDAEGSTFRGEQYIVTGTCVMNDSNLVVKVKLDRDCSTWLGCSSGETVYDTAQGKYVDICTNLAVCDQTLGSNGKDFCAHYVDRKLAKLSTYAANTVATEQVLRQGAFLDANAYTARPSGFGQPDYSGYAIPNHFQISDFQTRRVGYELLANESQSARNKYVNDFRIVAAVPLLKDSAKTLPSDGPVTLDPPAAATAKMLPPNYAVRYVDYAHSDLNLCQHAQTGQIGYFIGTSAHEPTEKIPFCYFAIDTPYARSTVEGGASVNPRNAQNLWKLFLQLDNANQDPQLTNAYPQPECKAHPDGSSPFPNLYVKEWDFTADPPKPKTFADGYDGASYCEYGEDCACSYRKVSYGSKTKYFSPFGGPAPSGICVGGNRDGQSCVPDAAIEQVASTSTGQVVNTPNGPSADQLCGTGGTCEAVQTISLVRGAFGQCLQRDLSRFLAGSQDFHPCLSWNPSPILQGANDVYHFQPRAGYLPPANSGEYYCVAGALPPSSIAVPVGGGGPAGIDNKSLFSSGWLKPPGSIPPEQFHYDDAFVSDGNCLSFFNPLLPDSVKCTGHEGTFIDGATAEGGAQGDACEQADDDQDKGGNGTDGNAARWIMTGRGAGANYAEYFIALDPQRWAQWLYHADTTSKEQQENAMFERNFAYFQFSPIGNPNGRGRLGCGYTPDWVDGLNVDNYNKLDNTQPGSKQWIEAFTKNFPGYLEPSSQDILHDKDGNVAKIPCYTPDAGWNGPDSRCYYKYWELGYRAEGEEKFTMQDDTPLSFSTSRYKLKATQATKAFFSIRAMFEDASGDDNKKTPDDTANGAKLGGPFRFIGWWVTASVPGADTERAIYMYLNIGHADICKEVAQVVAPDTREVTPFLDRISETGGYVIPSLGIAYSSTNPPFGSAKHTKPIGLTPLFQLRGALPGVKGRNPPSFIASGAEYFRPTVTPQGNWAWLTNIFARVYRIYRYSDRPVTKDSWACLGGPNFGSWCPTSATPDQTQKYCGYDGVCNPALLPMRAASQGRCNALSGVNAGRSCSNTGDDLTGYNACHNAALQFKSDTGEFVPLYKQCQLSSGSATELDGTTGAYIWRADDTYPDRYICVGDACGYDTKNSPLYPDGTSVPVSGWEIEPPTGIKQFYVVSDGTPDRGRFCFPVFDGTKYNPGACSGVTPALTHVYVKEKKLFARSELNTARALACAKGSIATKPGEILRCRSLTDGPSVECPAEVRGGTDKGDGYIYSQCVAGHCNNGFEQTACTKANEASDCEFTAAEWWGRNPDGSIPTKPTAWMPTASSIYHGGNDLTFFGLPAATGWWTATPESKVVSKLGVGDKEIPTAPGSPGDVAGNDLYGGRSVDLPASSASATLDRYPGAYAAGVQYSLSAPKPAFPGDSASLAGGTYEFIPSHCELPPASNSLDAAGSGYDKVSPYDEQRLVGGGPGAKGTKGLCDGGMFDGKSCTDNTQCQAKVGTDITKEQSDAVRCDYVYATPVAGSPNPCLQGGKNVCVHDAGYFPRMDLCGFDPTRQECLTGINQTSPGSFDPRNAPPPTDVTAGLYTPNFLGGFDPKYNQDYGYTSFYTPRPPTVAAPDTSKQCPASGSCPIAKVNAIDFENQTEGTVAYVGGQAITTMRFYGWAADNQGPLKDLWVDWGDGSVQEIQDASMKNKKPFCDVTKECDLVPGLTCNTDSDCPPAGGACLPVGSCKTRSTVSCHADADCAMKGKKDICVIRTTFGNSKNACEQNYFEFTHAYACGSEARTVLPLCAGYCSNNNAVSCTSDLGCRTGTKCLKTLGPPGGCFDAAAVSCRYTPRVLLKDNWGWCTGSCGGSGSTTVRLSNGGCYDTSRLWNNTDSSTKFKPYKISGSTEPAQLCDPASVSSNNSPWVVYQGALQLGITQ